MKRAIYVDQSHRKILIILKEIDNVFNQNNVPAQFRHDLRQEFFTRPFCCHLVRGRLQLLFKALLNDQEHFLCLASFAQVNTLLHAAVILVGSLSTPHAKNKTSGSLSYKNVIIDHK